MLSRDVICNLTLAAIIVVLLVRRYLQYAESQAVADAPAAALEEAAAPRRVIPTPTAIPGPAVMRSILGKCKHFKGGNAVEFCGFRSVKQITGAGSHYMGFWGKWITEEVDGKKKYLGQLYANGENCPGFGNRQTKVLFQCKETAKEMELIKEEEPVPCQYVLHVAYAGWCEVKPE